MADLDSILCSANLPTLPNVAIQLLQLTDQEDAGPLEYARVIRSDPAISVRLIQAANSSYYGLSSNVSTIESAVSMLGVTAAASLSLSFSLVSENHPGKNYETEFSNFWSRSLLQAIAAETISERFRIGEPAELFMAGLLCDIGVLAHLCVEPKSYSQVLADATSDTHLQQLELAEFGFDHAKLGQRLLDSWRMPKPLIETTACHLTTVEEGRDALMLDVAVPVHQLIRFVSRFGEYLEYGGSPEILKQLRAQAESLLKLNATELDALLEEIRDSTDQLAHAMAIDTATLPRPSELLAQANQHLVKIALREHASAAQTFMKSAELERENACLKAQFTELHREQGIDSLTQISNRREFDRVYPMHVESCSSLSHGLAVLFIDLDRFKRLNDTYGHRFGDEVLRKTCEAITAQTRESDFVARYGGEEIVVVLPKCKHNAAAHVGERIRAAVESTAFQLDGTAIQVTVSVGVCIAESLPFPIGNPHVVAEQILEVADAAMYASKHVGGNYVTLANFESNTKSSNCVST